MNLLFWKKKAAETEPRQIRANDTAFNAQFKYANNYISTSKYNILTFLPLNLFEQFTRLANVYFLFLLILQCIPQVSSLSPIITAFPLAAVLLLTMVKDLADDITIPEIKSLSYAAVLFSLILVLLITLIKDGIDDVLIPQISSLAPITTVVPLVFVLLISAVKDAVDDVQRHISDNMVNNRLSEVLRDGQLVEAKWQTVVVGDIIKMKNGQFVAADLLLLSASEPNSLCYIETAELDGETNLKVRQALTDTAEMEDSIDELKNFNGEVKCEPPNNILSRFEGVLNWRDQTYALDNDKVLLRGCVLRNTEWCFGVVLFAGKDTKLMMNSGKTKFKRTHIDRLMNLLIISIFLFLMGMCSICTIGSGIWESKIGYRFQEYLPWEDFVPGSIQKALDSSQVAGGSTVIALLVFLSYIIVLNTVVPISLYVSVEMIRFGHSWWINWDTKMFYEKTNTPAKSRTTTLNEELGQIEYIFSDKTGTLTQNIMTFNKCSINGVSYGDLLNKRGMPMDITDKTPKVDFSKNPYYEKTFDFYDPRLLELALASDEKVSMLFRLLALCHTVMPAEKDGVLEYQAQSPDEAALVGAARNFGFVFKSRTPSTITIEVHGEVEVYQLLCILDFNNVRKRMSVIVRKDDEICLLCKGADSTIYERLDPKCLDLQSITTTHLEKRHVLNDLIVTGGQLDGRLVFLATCQNFAQDGLRTLCCAAKKIDVDTYEEWKIRHHEASTSLENRDDKLSAVYEEIEEGMILIGATAIEDKLQDGVPEAIANLANADIKIWVLTGDKQETAINIGYSCHLLTEEMSNTIYVVDAESSDDVRNQLLDHRSAMMAILNKSSSYELGISGSRASSNDQLIKNENGAKIPLPPTTGEFALILNGHSLVHALKPEMELLLLETGCMCKAVICCRVTPLQKALVVNLVKKHKKSITLAIGDGANDVSMIKMAHIGIGISGQEGLQAVLASDFSIAQFRYLERLLLVHGRWSYLRMCKFLKYFFYKNFAFTLCHFWFAFFCGFSAQTLYDPYFITFYNVFYTSLPIMALGFFDQDVSEKLSLQYPRMYTPGHMDLFFNKKVFAQSVAEGIITSLVLFFIPLGSFEEAIQPDGVDISGHRAFGVVVAACLIVAVTLRCGLDTYYWTGFNHFTIWGSIIFFFLFTFLMYIPQFGYTYSGTVQTVMSTANFWFTLLLTVVVILIPVVAERFYFIDTRPTLTDRLRVKQKIGDIKAKAGVRIVRRASTLRRSQRSVGRSGYAFAHQEGFGQLITSGSIMRRKPKSEKKESSSVAKGLASHFTAASFVASSSILESPGMDCQPMSRISHTSIDEMKEEESSVDGKEPTEGGSEVPEVPKEFKDDSSRSSNAPSGEPKPDETSSQSTSGKRPSVEV